MFPPFLCQPFISLLRGRRGMRGERGAQRARFRKRERERARVFIQPLAICQEHSVLVCLERIRFYSSWSWPSCLLLCPVTVCRNPLLTASSSVYAKSLTGSYFGRKTWWLTTINTSAFIAVCINVWGLHGFIRQSLSSASPNAWIRLASQNPYRCLDLAQIHRVTGVKHKKFLNKLFSQTKTQT